MQSYSLEQLTSMASGVSESEGTSSASSGEEGELKEGEAKTKKQAIPLSPVTFVDVGLPGATNEDRALLQKFDNIQRTYNHFKIEYLKNKDKPAAVESYLNAMELRRKAFRELEKEIFAISGTA